LSTVEFDLLVAFETHSVSKIKKPFENVPNKYLEGS
jgi:hypothetical protein